MRSWMVWAMACYGLAAAAEPRVLVFGKVQSGEYVHEAIGVGARAIIAMGGSDGFAADSTSDARVFTAANLARYRAVVFNNTGGDILDEAQRAAFQGFLRAGGGYAGIHSACGTEYSWPWYGEMLGGARFLRHPAIQKAALKVEDGKHPSTSMLPARWERVDEWHDYRANPRAKVRVLLTVDEASYQGGTMGADHPIAWSRDFEGGRAWFTGLGHTLAGYQEDLFLAHLRGGIRYAMGDSPTATFYIARRQAAVSARFEVAPGRPVWMGPGGKPRDARGALMPGP